MKDKLRIRELGLQDFEPVWREMQDFTAARDEETVDELWFVEHPPVFTLGVGGKHEHILNAHDIPVIRSNRGGQVTYHGPGQIVAYVLFDIRRRNIRIRQLVTLLEDTVIDLLARYRISAQARRDAPGVYVNDKKIAALGLRVSRGCSYHGLALNVDMDLTPFAWINPCGFAGLEATQLLDLGVKSPTPAVREQLAAIIADKMNYDTTK